MKFTHVAYKEQSETIRLFPQNYLIAFDRGGRWIIDPDKAIPEDLAVEFFKVYMRLPHSGGVSFVKALNEVLQSYRQ